MKQRHGGKFGKKHGTLTDAAVVIADIGNKCPHVTRVIPGVISAPRGSSGSSRHVKVTCKGHALHVSVSSNASHQQMHMYTSDKAQACKWMQAEIEKVGFKFVDATAQ
jgi:hypothetical protein